MKGLASASACAVDLSGCQVARVKSTRVWSLIYFLNMFKVYLTMKWCVSAWTIWGLRAEWTLNMGTEASKGWLFCGDAARSRISQDRKNYFLRDCAYCRFEYICRTVVWLRQQALRWEAAGLRLKLKERRTWTGWKILLWRWRLQDFDNFTGQAKNMYFSICSDCCLEKLQDLTCAASACYVRNLDHWLCQVLTFLESLVRV